MQEDQYSYHYRTPLHHQPMKAWPIWHCNTFLTHIEITSKRGEKCLFCRHFSPLKRCSAQNRREVGKLSQQCFFLSLMLHHQLMKAWPHCHCYAFVAHIECCCYRDIDVQGITLKSCWDLPACCLMPKLVYIKCTRHGLCSLAL